MKANDNSLIITVNLSDNQIMAMDHFVTIHSKKKKINDPNAEEKAYFSRSEWIRCAVKRLLLKEIQLLKQEKKEDCNEFNHNHQDKVKIPLSNGICKEYRIIARLE